MHEAEPITFAAGAQAFGDGQHPTTKMVLAALEAIDAKIFTPRIACDMGCGSGILSLSIATKFHCKVVAVDLLRESVEATRENAARNQLVSHVHPVHSDGFRHADIDAHAPFDLIVMNSLAEPLLGLAADAYARLAPGGVLILSGIFVWQETQLREAYQSLGLELTQRLALKDWVALVWQKQ
jgi:ribosomal protein L11 methyltransferase